MPAERSSHRWNRARRGPREGTGAGKVRQSDGEPLDHGLLSISSETRRRDQQVLHRPSARDSQDLMLQQVRLF